MVDEYEIPTKDPETIKDSMLIDDEWMEDMHRVYIKAEGCTITWRRRGHSVEIVVEPYANPKIINEKMLTSFKTPPGQKRY